ncbi:MAG TPA: efflux RND transporter periplasmic adaptor subunit [Candidatus Acidoferrales bacterium]|nr:efflux RND transporter periplasmic adaptor subunit [Candidatus Acidoferrales bacterium]
MHRRFPTVFLGAALFAAACGDDKSSTASVTNAAPAPTSSKPVLAGTEPSGASILVSGPIIVEHQVDLTAQRDGIVQKIFFDAPARVKSGTLLAELDGRQIGANLEASRAKTRSIAADLKNWESESEVLKADYARAQHLFDLGLTSEEQLQHAKYKAESDQWDILRVKETLNNAKEEEHSLELELEKTKVIAPFDGLIARRYARQGQNVGKGDRLFWVTAESPLLMRFTLPEKAFGKIRIGQPMEVLSPDVPGEKHRARVKQVSPVVDPSSGTFEVLVELVGERGSLRPGMTASVQLDTPQ